MEAERFEAGGQQVLLEYPQDVQAFAARAVEVIQRAASAGLKLQDGTRIQMGRSSGTDTRGASGLRHLRPGPRSGPTSSKLTCAETAEMYEHSTLWGGRCLWSGNVRVGSPRSWYAI